MWSYLFRSCGHPHATGQRSTQTCEKPHPIFPQRVAGPTERRENLKPNKVAEPAGDLQIRLVLVDI